MAGEIFDPLRQNFVFGSNAGPGPAPVGASTSTGLIDPKRPNFTMPNQAPAAAPRPFTYSPTQPQAVADAVLKRGVLDADVGGAARRGLRAGGDLVRGAARSLTSGAGRALIPAGLAAEALDTATTDTDEFYRRTGIVPGQSDLGRLGTDIAARGLGTLQNIGNNVTFGLADRVGNLIAGNGFNRSPDASAPAATPAVMPTPASQIQASYSNEGRNYRDPGQTTQLRAGPNPAGQILRDGNSYSGKDIKFGADIMQNGTLRNSGGTVTVLDTSEGARQDRLELDRLRAENAQRERPDPYGPGANGGITGITSEDPAIANARRDRENRLSDLARTMRNGQFSRERAGAAAAYAALSGQALPGAPGSENDTQLKIATLRDRGETTRANAALKAASADREAAREVTMRGQDLTYGAHRETNRLNAAKEQRDIFEKDRQFQVDVAKFGLEQAEKNRTARAAEQAAVDKNLESMFRTTDSKGNDVADTARIGDYKRAVETSLAALIKRHEATGKPQNLAVAKQLKERGLAALSVEDHDQLRALYDRRERAMQSRGMLRGGANVAQSDNLFDYEQTGRDPRLFGGDRIRMPAGDISVNDLRYTEPSNRILPDWFKTEQRDLMRGIR